LPTTKVTGDVCWDALVSAVLAELRNDRRETRGRGIVEVVKRYICSWHIGRKTRRDKARFHADGFHLNFSLKLTSVKPFVF
jgi:hypothetical protein